MNITTNRKELASALKFVSPAAARNPMLPILAGVKLEQYSGTLTLTCSDMDVTYSAEVYAKGPKSECVAPADLLAQIIDAMGGESVTIEADEKVTVTSGETVAVLPSWPAKDWPQMEKPDDDPVTYTGEQSDRLASILCMASDDLANQKLTGVHFVDSMAVTTDSFRMGVVTDLPEVRDSLVPAARLKGILRGEDVTAAFGDRLASFRSGNRTVTVQQIEASYPEHERLFPANPPSRLVVSGPALAESAGRVAAIGLDTKNPRVTLQRDGDKLIIVGEDGIGGSVTDVIHCSGDYDGTIGFKPVQLSDMLAAVGDEVTLLITDELKPVTIEESGLRLLCMPVRTAQIK